MKTLGRLLRAALDLFCRVGDAVGLRGARWEWKKQGWRQALEARVAAWENLERGVRARTRMCRECRTLVQRRERTCPACGASMSGIPSGGLGRLLSVVSPAFGTATTLLITVNVGMSLLILILWGTSGSAAGPMRFLSPPWQALYVFGEKALPVVFQGEPWRLITANYLHGGLLHLLFNCYALATLGPLIEESFGARKFFVIYTVCGVFAFFLSALFSRAPAVGASGALFGLMGFGIVVRRRGVDIRRSPRAAATIGAASGLSGSDPGGGMRLSERLEISQTALLLGKLCAAPVDFPVLPGVRLGEGAVGSRVVPHIDRQVTPGDLAIAQHPRLPVALPPAEETRPRPAAGVVFLELPDPVLPDAIFPEDVQHGSLPLLRAAKMVPRDGIEPPTQGFSVPRSTD